MLSLTLGVYFLSGQTWTWNVRQETAILNCMCNIYEIQYKLLLKKCWSYLFNLQTDCLEHAHVLLSPQTEFLFLLHAPKTKRKIHLKILKYCNFIRIHKLIFLSDFFFLIHGDLSNNFENLYWKTWDIGESGYLTLGK